MKNPFVNMDVEPMLIGASSDPFDDPDSLFEVKLDGVRCLAYLDGERTALVTRRGRRVHDFLPELADLGRQTGARCLLDGELIAGVGNKEDFARVMSRLMHTNRAKSRIAMGHTPVVFVAFDMLFQGDEWLLERPLSLRKERLEKDIEESEGLILSRYVEERGKEFFSLAVGSGLEGVIGKKKDSLYRPGKRTADWVKVKNMEEEDYVICGYLLAEHVARLVLGQYDGHGQMQYKGRVVLGRKNPDFGLIEGAARAETWPFAEPPPEAAEEAVWLLPSMVCSVDFLRHTDSGAMRQPHYRGLRVDVAAEDVLEKDPFV